MTGGARPSRFGVGAVLEVKVADYLYGLGTLALRVTAVEVDPAQHRAMEWVNVNGIELYENGATGPERFVTIRVSAIKSALRPASWTPSNSTRAAGP